MGRVVVPGLLVLAILLVSTPFAAAQYRASIQGVVTDPQGSVVPAATVTLKNEETGISATVSTNENGIYNFNGLPPSKFTITVEKPGFKVKVVKGFGVLAEQANSLNVTLEVGQASESVTVDGDATPLIDTETANLGGTVKASDIQKLPSFGRDPFQLLQLAPGAFGDGAQGAGGGTSNLPGTTVGGTGGTDGVFKIENGGQISANGARTGENNYQLDGVGTTSVTWGGTSVVTPNEDSIKEVKIITDNYDAENGRFRGAQVQIISQNGTNNYHGSLFFKIHRPGLNASTKYNGYDNGNTKDANRFNNWGGSAGGPILRNKLFLFFSYETLDNNAQQATGGGWYETPQFRALAASGTNAAAILNYAGVGPNGGQFVEKTCADIGLVENVNCRTISGQGLNIGSPLTSALGSLDPSYQGPANPGLGGDGTGGPQNLSDTPDIAFYQGTISPNRSTHRQYNGRIDFNPTKSDLVAFSIFYVPNTSTSINGNGDRLMNLFNSQYTNRAMTAIWDHTFSPTVVNEARVNAAGWLQKDLSENPNGAFGLPQVSFTAPNGAVVGSANLQGYGIGSFNGFDQWTYAAKDVLTKVQGAHTLKMGAEFTRLLSVDAPFWADRPGYSFNNIWDFLNDAPVSESAQFDPQTGVPSALRKDLRSNVIGVFFQDNWKVRSNLTLTAGLRWEYFGAISEKNNKLATVEFGSGDDFFTGMHVRTGGHLYDPQKTNFGPQLGFAWSPRGAGSLDFQNKLVFRGGFGIAYNGIAQSNSLDGRFNPPFVSNGQSFSGCQVIPGDPSTNGCKILYINSFPSDPTSPNGYAANPNAILTFGSNNLPTTCCVDLTAFPSTWPTTYTYHYTLGAQYDLGNQWMVSVGYQGSSTRHLTEHYNLYNVGAVSGLAFNPVVHGVTYYADDGGAHFNALLMELKHDFSKSFMLDAQYRLSHSVDTGSNAYAGPFYQWNLSTLYATSDYDTRNAFKLYGIWSPVLFRGSHSWAEKIVGGWTISGIMNLHSGFPWTPQYSTNDLSNGFDPVFYFSQFGGGSSSDAGSGTVLPTAYLGGFNPNFRSSAVVDASSFFSAPDVSGGVLFDCLFVTAPTPACPTGRATLGPLPSAPGIKRNSFTGPGYFDVDATLSKSFGLPTMKVIGENGRIELRANFFNLFNKLNLTNIQNNILNSHFGEAQNALGSRTIELQARFSF